MSKDLDFELIKSSLIEMKVLIDPRLPCSNPLGNVFAVIDRANNALTALERAQQAQEVDIIAVTKATYEFINNNGYNIQELVEFIINKSKDYLQQPDVCPNCKITLKFKKHGAVHKINQQPEKGNE